MVQQHMLNMRNIHRRPISSLLSVRNPAGVHFIVSSLFFAYVMYEMWRMVESAIKAGGDADTTNRKALVRPAYSAAVFSRCIMCPRGKPAEG
jgi:hypothetical protein